MIIIVLYYFKFFFKLSQRQVPTKVLSKKPRVYLSIISTCLKFTWAIFGANPIVSEKITFATVNFRKDARRVGRSVAV